MSINKAILIGNLGQDPETRYTTGGDAVTNFSIATTERWKDKDGEPQSRTEWHRIVCWRRLAEVAGEYLKSGHKVYVEGKLQTRKYEKDGQDHYSTEIVADKIDFLEKKQSSESEEPREKPKTSVRKPAKGGKGPVDDLDDDIPF